MKSMTLLIRGSMVSLCALALIAAYAPNGASAQPSRPRAESGSTPHTEAWPPTGLHLPGGRNAAVPRGDLRADITDNARQRPPPRQEPPAPLHH